MTPYDEDNREAEKNVTLKRTAYADGVVLPMLMGWQTNLSHSMLDPTDITRERFLEEVAEELGHAGASTTEATGAAPRP